MQLSSINENFHGDGDLLDAIPKLQWPPANNVESLPEHSIYF